METKQINVVWFDDKVDKLEEQNRELFKHHHCVLYAKAKTSDELEQILKDKRNYIDAVIVDFNVSSSDLFPDKESASGFRWVHEHLKEYSPLPFYLYSARDWDFIKNKYCAFEFNMDGDYFFSLNENVVSKRNRYFQGNELEDLLKMIEEEASCIKTPEFKVRQEYHKAFEAIEEFGLDADVFMKILLSDESIDRYDLIRFANPLRKVIESMVAKMADKGIVPIWFNDNLNGTPDLLSGHNHKFKSYYNFLKDEDFMHEALCRAFKWFLEYTQDGSHNKKYLSIGFEEYLKSSRDIYIVKALAIICLDVIKWAHLFYGKCIENPPFNIYKLKVIEFDEKKRAIVSYDDESNSKIFTSQPINEDLLQVGTNLEICVTDIYQFDKSSKFFCNKWKAQLNKPIRGTISEIRNNGAIMYYGEKIVKIFVPQPLNKESKLHEGTTIEIHKISTTLPKFGDFYCSNYRILNNIDD